MAPFALSAILDSFGLGKPNQNTNPSPQRTRRSTDNITPICTTTPQSPSCIHKESSFLGLPAEIRNEIYSYIFTGGEIHAKTQNHGPNDKLNLLLTCKQTHCEARLIAFATQPAFLDLWSGSWDFLHHARCAIRVSSGCMLGSARISEKISHHMPVENIQRLVLRHFDWKKGSEVKFKPVGIQTFQKLRPEEIYLHGYYCGNKFTYDLYVNFLTAIPFLAKIFTHTSQFIAHLCIDECFISYGFETEVAWAHYSLEIVSKGVGHGWELLRKERLERGGMRLIYTVMNDGDDSEVQVRTVTFEMRLLILNGNSKWIERLEGAAKVR
jgi:hypothetical protein